MNTYKTPIRYFASLIMLCALYLTAYSQQISVMQFDGDAYTYNTNDSKVKYKKIVFGPLPDADKILVKGEGTLKLLNEKNEICEVSGEGEYDIKSLKFVKSESNSLFNKFCDYFHSFFVNHSSSESKSNYKNSIHAISRGILSPPQLDFPLDGMLPSTSGSISFSWSHSCDNCQYVVTIYDLDTRASVYAWTTKEQIAVLENADQFLHPEKRYYWTVTISGQEMEYPIARISIASKDDYNSKLQQLESELLKTKLQLNEATKAIYIMGNFEDKDLINYALFYGQQATSTHPSDMTLGDFVDRFWYDTLGE